MTIHGKDSRRFHTWSQLQGAMEHSTAQDDCAPKLGTVDVGSEAPPGTVAVSPIANAYWLNVSSWRSLQYLMDTADGTQFPTMILGSSKDSLCGKETLGIIQPYDNLGLTLERPMVSCLLYLMQVPASGAP